MTGPVPRSPAAAATGRAIQAAVLFSTILGVLFLWVAKDLLPREVFLFISAGWVLFLIDSVLTFVRPRLSYYLGFVLALLALGSSLPQSAHYAFIEEGQVLPAAIFIVGSSAQVALLALVIRYAMVTRRSRPESG